MMVVISITSLLTLSTPTNSSIFSTFTFTTSLHPNFAPKLSAFSPISSPTMASSTVPLASSSTAAAELEALSSVTVSQRDLLIVGPGVLGRLVANKWREEYPECQIYGQTITTDHHQELAKLAITPCLKETKPICCFPYVIFCAPPYPSPDYSSDIKFPAAVYISSILNEKTVYQRNVVSNPFDKFPEEAVSSWDGKGCFLFTSSSAPYDCNDNGYCDENTPSVPIGRSPRTDVLLKAEKVVLDSNGCVVRLAGLYTEDRGAHIYWLQKEVVEARPDHILNLIHYEDAASLAVTILKKNLRGKMFLGCDNHPLSRHEIMDLVNKSGKFSKKFETFTGSSDPLGKRLDNSKTRMELGWEPKHPSFAHFLESM